MEASYHVWCSEAAVNSQIYHARWHWNIKNSYCTNWIFRLQNVQLWKAPACEQIHSIQSEWSVEHSKTQYGIYMLLDYSTLAIFHAFIHPNLICLKTKAINLWKLIKNKIYQHVWNCLGRGKDPRHSIPQSERREASSGESKGEGGLVEQR